MPALRRRERKIPVVSGRLYRYTSRVTSPRGTLKATVREPTSMEWVTPQHEEIDLNCEVSSYANAEL